MSRPSNPALASLVPLALAAVDASEVVACRMKAYDALAMLLHEQRDPSDFGCVSPAELTQLLLTLNVGMREAVAAAGAAVDQLLEAGKAVHQQVTTPEA